MYTETKISDFYCEYCHRQFSVADYNNDVDATREAVIQHQKECRETIKICLGSVFIFNYEERDQYGNVISTEPSPPLKVISIDTKTNPQNA